MLCSIRQCLMPFTATFILASWLVIRQFTTPVAFGQDNVPSASHHENSDPTNSASNETLGFERIFVLSHSPSWRTRGFAAAANLTGLRYTIPPQPPVRPELSDAFSLIGSEDGSKERPSIGGSRAWLAHLDLIKHVYQLNLDTTLILEDDADWDVSLRIQMQNIASSIRNLTLTHDEEAPYGRAWDLLWIGHCGEVWKEEFKTVLFDDIAVCTHANYSGWAKHYMSTIPEGKRAVYWSSNPVCSFAYALSHNGARKVLDLTGAGQGEAFDVKMMWECKVGNLKCISVVPEVVHQYFPAPYFGVKSLKDIGDGEAPGPEESSFEFVKGSTENILHSARCKALWGETCLRS